MDPIQLDDNRPHFVIQGFKAVHVIPRVVFQKIADGKLPIDETSDYNDWLPTIIKEWLDKPK